MAATRADPVTERKTILDAALRVMRRNGYDECQITDILSESSLSTRAFYRHFDTKDDVLLALFRDNAEETSRRLAARVGAAATPVERLRARTEEILSLDYDRRRASRVRVLASGAARRTAGYAEERARANTSLYALLRAVLDDGRASGASPDCVPADDAPTIHPIAWRLVSEALSGAPSMDEESARHHVLRFSLPAVGIRERRVR